MKKIMLILTALLCAGIVSYAQDQILVRYDVKPFNDEGFTADLLDFLDIKFAQVRFNEEAGDKVFSIKQVVCRGGEFTETDLLEMFPSEVRNIKMLRFIASTHSRDKVKIMVTTNYIGFPAVEIDMPTKGYHIFMETMDADLGEDPEIKDENGYVMPAMRYPSGVEIPLMAFTTGFETEKDGEIWRVDYCGLRNKRLHPRLWYEKFGIGDYIYYTVKFE